MTFVDLVIGLMMSVYQPCDAGPNRELLFMMCQDRVYAFACQNNPKFPEEWQKMDCDEQGGDVCMETIDYVCSQQGEHG